jgi:hypothetical protein
MFKAARSPAAKSVEQKKAAQIAKMRIKPPIWKKSM